ncbi:hypothetical protein [Streptomyces halobius]|uniref:Integral membrane protein n=1 Tax=Streptomyces halobius TaxID=2879846 RepID=A0ABY4M653_9ACTN|nr:hypothetical protein [Streptomyces halobius]UQA93237.1 hypothetical protein K9S39_16545 [Streptomyces halobius]
MTASETERSMPDRTPPEGPRREPTALPPPSARKRTKDTEGGEGANGAKGPEGAVPRPVRRGSADPVRALMHRHRKLCERAVDALEIAAGLEAHGVTDRMAARFRHRDVFSLAEELYARVPRAESDGAPAQRPEPGGRSRSMRAALHLLPGAVCVAVAAAVTSADEPTPLLRPVIAATGIVLIVLAVRLGVRSGPLRLRHQDAGSGAAGLWICWTVGYAVYGDWLLAQLLAGGPDLPYVRPRAALATAVALAFGIAPAAWCAHRFAVRGRRCLAASRGLTELAARTRPLLLGVTLLFLGALVTLLLGAGLVFRGGSVPGTVAAAALGMLLFLARLLALHGFPGAAAAGMAAAAALEALALAMVLIARLPGLAPAGRPVEALAAALGPAAVPALACGAAALGLLVHGLRALTGACAHSPSVPAEADRP